MLDAGSAVSGVLAERAPVIEGNIGLGYQVPSLTTGARAVPAYRSSAAMPGPVVKAVSFFPQWRCS